MKRLRLVHDPSPESTGNEKDRTKPSKPEPPETLKFPGVLNEDGRLESADRLFELMDSMSRRIDDLARELNCFGHFDGDDDGPRAA